MKYNPEHVRTTDKRIHTAILMREDPWIWPNDKYEHGRFAEIENWDTASGWEVIIIRPESPIPDFMKWMNDEEQTTTNTHQDNDKEKRLPPKKRKYDD